MSARPPEAGLDLAEGVLVVYGSYGVGRVSLRRAARPAEPGSESVVLEFPSGLSVTLPMERALECLRPLSGEEELAAVREVLQSPGGPSEGSWQLRTRATRETLAEGDVLGLAQVVRDAVRRTQASTTRSDSLSSHERDLYLKARRLLATEIAAARGLDDAAAEAWIDEQLGQDAPAQAG